MKFMKTKKYIVADLIIMLSIVLFGYLSVTSCSKELNKVKVIELDSVPKLPKTPSDTL